ncbi:DBB domain-containing protein stumps isoform X2 [Halictus rubicundus]|uniref:DBB domain-containing protein stumps isoform X2 n=1 Tax=Halictus rubicundus TaxID=77578 RepID=UPI004036CF2C
MAVDNPSYFSLSSGAASSSTATPATSTTNVAFSPPAKGPTGLTALFRRRACKMGATSSASTVSTSTASTTLMHQESNRSSASGASTPSTPTEERVPMLSRNGIVHGNGNHGGACQRRSFRNLFRSVSANADNERTQQFLKGDPRPSDVAPPSPYLPHRSHSHSENDRRRPGRSRAVLKSASELLSNDMVYCGLARDSHRHDDDDDDDDDPDSSEVFIGVDDARYYNLSSTLPAPGSAAAGRRRHSIGTFLGKDRGATSKDNVARRQAHNTTAMVEPDTMAPPAPVDTVDGVEDRAGRSCSRTRRRRHRSSSSKGSRSATGLSKIDSHPEDDVFFVSSKDSEISSLWVNYLTACFEQISRQQGRPPFKVRHITVEETIPPGTEERIRTARLQIVVVCPVLLERVQSRPEHATSLARHLVSDKVLAMMLGVHDSHISDAHRSILVSYNQWRKFFVKDQDETFVGELLGAAVGILGTTPPPALRSDKTAFSVHPKKVKLGHNRIIALLNDPVRPEDNVSVIVDRCGEAIDIAHVKRRNPYALQFSIPERCLEVSMLVGVRISKNGCPLGVRQVKCESRLRELDQILRAHDNPLEFMCQTFGFNPGDREQLDNWMVHAFQRNVPPHFSLLSTPSGVVSTQKVHSSPEDNPTLLHFAARFGLERLAWQLLECPGGDIACDLRNVSELTPADLAEQAGHARLAHQLRGYMQMNEFTNMYSYLKVISETTNDQAASADPSTTNTTNETSNDKEDYCRPRPLSEAYSVPPAARPITSLILPGQLPVTPSPTTTNPIEANYSIVPAPTPVLVSPSTPTAPATTPNGLELPLQGYMKMHPAGPKTPTSNVASQQPSRTATPTQNRQDHASPREENSQSSCFYGRTASSSSAKSREPSGPQDELLEIINDFKNNVFTINEVERLVENWRNRNDVQQSFKDKQRQLTAMREEYDRIQKRLKEEMKAPTPFDRIRKFFSKGKKDSKDSANGSDDSSTASKTENINGGLADRRPVSSLSLRSVSSSSSSGRMSTASGCSGTSLGDSGTHSDTEDRRLQNAREDKPGVMSYEIPPAPKPFAGRYSPALRYSPSPRSSTGNDLDLRPQLPPKTDDAEYYIAFPPSGLPIHSFKPDHTLKEPKTPSSPCDHPKYLDMLQGSSPGIADTPDSDAARQPGNSYANVEPAVVNPAPAPPPGMCIPTNYMNITPGRVTPLQEVVQSQQRNSGDLSQVAETPKNPAKVETPSEDVKTPDEGQGPAADTVANKNNEEYVETDLVNGSCDVDVPDGGRMPDYMNVDLSQEIKVVKKAPAPPVPPRGATKK